MEGQLAHRQLPFRHGDLNPLYIPQWLFGVSVGEAAAIYCFYSIVITGSFMPQFKGIFTSKLRPREIPEYEGYRLNSLSFVTERLNKINRR